MLDDFSSWRDDGPYIGAEYTQISQIAHRTDTSGHLSATRRDSAAPTTVWTVIDRNETVRARSGFSFARKQGVGIPVSVTAIERSPFWLTRSRVHLLGACSELALSGRAMNTVAMQWVLLS